MINKKVTLEVEISVNEEFNNWSEKEREFYLSDHITDGLDDIKIIKIETVK